MLCMGRKKWNCFLYNEKQYFPWKKKDDKRKMILEYKHDGQPTNNSIHQDTIKSKIFVANDNRKIIDPVDNKQSEQHKEFSQRFGRSFRMTFRSLNTDRQR